MNFVDLLLGFISSAGGFIDISNLVFNPQSAAKFGYALLWPMVVGAIGIAVYAEMCGRVAAIAKKPVFDLIRERTGFNIAMITLIASNIVNLLIATAEIGGVAIMLQLFSGLSYRGLLFVAFGLLLLILWFIKFKYLEWIFGIMGMFMVTFLVAAIKLSPNWHQVVLGFVPSIPFEAKTDMLDYLYFAIGLLGSLLMPYQVYFYSSGGIEEGWKEKDLITNKITTYAGYALGAILAIALSIVAGTIFFPGHIQPQAVGTILLGPALTMGKVGLILGMIGMLFSIGGAAMETSLAGAYNLSQFFGWQWGKFQRPSEAPRFTLSWLIMLIVAVLVLLTGIDPVKITNLAVIFSVVVYPLTYIPILLVANDKRFLGKHANGRVTNVLAWVYLVILLVVAISAVPLLILSKGGNG